MEFVKLMGSVLGVPVHTRPRSNRPERHYSTPDDLKSDNSDEETIENSWEVKDHNEETYERTSTSEVYQTRKQSLPLNIIKVSPKDSSGKSDELNNKSQDTCHSHTYISADDKDYLPNVEIVHISPEKRRRFFYRKSVELRKLKSEIDKEESVEDEKLLSEKSSIINLKSINKESFYLNPIVDKSLSSSSIAISCPVLDANDETIERTYNKAFSLRKCAPKRLSYAFKDRPLYRIGELYWINPNPSAELIQERVELIEFFKKIDSIDEEKFAEEPGEDFSE